MSGRERRDENGRRAWDGGLCQSGGWYVADGAVGIMITQTVAMFLMMAVGIVLIRAKMLDAQSVSRIANIAVYVSTPAVVLNSLATTFDMDRLVGGIWCFSLSALFTAASGVVARLVFRDRKRVAQVGVLVSNMGFLGVPLVESVVGEEYVFYVSACIAAQIPFIWSYGLWLITQDRSTISLRRIVTNPSIIAVVVGVALFLCSVSLTGVLEVAVSDMANLNTGLAMLILGSYLAQTDIRSLLRDTSLYLANFLRLVVVPALCVAVLAVLPLSTPIKLTVLIANSAPCGTTSALFSQLFGGDYRYGAGLVSSSTLLSLVTLPAVLAAGLAVF